MFKKILALILAMLMVSAVFVGCGEDEDDDAAASVAALWQSAL